MAPRRRAGVLVADSGRPRGSDAGKRHSRDAEDGAPDTSPIVRGVVTPAVRAGGQLVSGSFTFSRRVRAATGYASRGRRTASTCSTVRRRAVIIARQISMLIDGSINCRVAASVGIFQWPFYTGARGAVPKPMDLPG